MKKNILKSLFVVISLSLFSAFGMQKFQAVSVTDFKKNYVSGISSYGIKDLVPLRRVLFLLKPGKSEESVKFGLMDSIDFRFAQILKCKKEDIKRVLDAWAMDEANKDKTLSAVELKEMLKKLVSKPEKTLENDEEDLKLGIERSKFKEIEGRLNRGWDLKVEDLTKMANDIKGLKKLGEKEKGELIASIGIKIMEVVEKLNSSRKPEKPIEVFDAKSPAAKKAELLVEFAKTNGMIIGEDVFKVGDATNNVYQLRVNKQGVNTCGPRACFNCLKLIEYFDPVASKGTAEIQESFRLVKEEANPEVEAFLKDAAEKLKIKYPPVNLDILQLQDIARGKNLTVIEEYRVLDIENYVQDVNLKQKSVGFCWGFVFKYGTVEREMTLSESIKSVDHWICIFVVKVGNKKNSWFIADSMNGSQFNTTRIKAYIYKFLGETYDVYENEMVEKQKIVDKKEELETISQIFDMVSRIGKPEVLAGIVKQYSIIDEIKVSDDDAINRFLAEKIIEISAMRYFDKQARSNLIEKIVNAGKGKSGVEFLDRLNKDIVGLKKLVVTEKAQLESYLKNNRPGSEKLGIVVAQEIVCRLAKNGYFGAENIKSVVIGSIKNAFGLEIEDFKKKLGEFDRNKK